MGWKASITTIETHPLFINDNRALQVTYQRLEAWMSSRGEYHHGNASLNLFTAAPNLIKVLHNLVRRPHLQTKSFPTLVKRTALFAEFPRILAAFD